MSTFEVLIAIASAAFGVLGIYIGVSNILRRGKEPKSAVTTLAIERYGERLEVDTKTLSADELEKVFQALTRVSERKKRRSVTRAAPTQEQGYITSEFLVYVVPGVIALLFAIAFVYLLVHNDGTAGYSVPKELTTAMTTIVGYYFGIGASAATHKAKHLTAAEARRLIATQAKTRDGVAPT